MLIFPAIDLYSGAAVRLYKGEYEKMTVYNENPEAVADDFKKAGAGYIHVVDLEGAKNGDTPNFDTVIKIKRKSGLFCEIGGGIRSIEKIERYINSGIDRVIIGTAAVTDRDFLQRAIDKYNEKIAVGIDLKDGFVSIKGWTEKTSYTKDAFFDEMQKIGVGTIICTDISKDGAMLGTNRSLYSELVRKYSGKINVTASGGVSTLDDVKALSDTGLYGAIIGKAYYTGAIDLKSAIEVAK